MGLKNQNIFAPSQELPPYALRVSRKARRVILRIAPGKGLEVVLPLGVKDSCVPGVLLRHKEWIERKLAALPKQEAAAVSVVPDMLRLKGGREEVAIRIIDRPGCRCRRDGVEACPAGGRSGLPVPAVERRVLELPAGEPEAIRARLKEWVRQEAKAYLGGILSSTAREHGFKFSSFNVRFQKTRWGSCSSKGSINLNAGLIFLPEALSRYIIAHELCHTRVMNHSSAFWKELFKVDPDALSRDKAIRTAWRYTPGWLYE